MEGRLGCIYMLRNSKNNKIYIGKTIRDISVRVDRHKKDAKAGSQLAIHRAIRKYGFENFEIIILEKDIPESILSEKEKYYISKYASIKNGYNLSPGGDGGRLSRYTDEQIKEVKVLLRDTSLTANEIAEKTGVSVHMVRDINRGRRLKTPDFITPIRDIKHVKFLTEKEAIEIQKLLMTGKFKLSQIADKYNCSVVVISKINLGKSHYNSSLKYPLMLTNNIHTGCHTEEEVRNVISLLATSDYSISEIARITGFSEPAVHDINLGHSWSGFWDGDFPIKKYSWITEEQVLFTIDLIQNSLMSVDEICKCANISRGVYYMISIGKHKYCKNLNLKFPVERLKYNEQENKKIDIIIDLFVNDGLSVYAIQKKTGINKEFIIGVIKGTNHLVKERSYNFPLIRGNKKV